MQRVQLLRTLSQLPEEARDSDIRTLGAAEGGIGGSDHEGGDGQRAMHGGCISVGIEDVKPADWVEQVYKPDNIGKPDTLTTLSNGQAASLAAACRAGYAAQRIGAARPRHNQDHMS